MGCDIHLFIEYKRYDTWWNFGREFRLTRHYSVFAALADVRNYSNIECDVPIRGIPDSIAWDTKEEYCLRIKENPHDELNETSREMAENWIEQGYSKYWDASKEYITDSDAHSASHLTPDEFEAAIRKAVGGQALGGVHEYEAVLAAMRALESAGFNVRTVFWFDN